MSDLLQHPGNDASGNGGGNDRGKDRELVARGASLPANRERPHVVILGAGPAGVGAAWQVAQRGLARVTVLEQREGYGGNAGSFELEGLRVDYGSHRLHPACDPAILRDLRALLGDDLLDRPRHGRIRLGGRWIHFPLKPVDLLLRVPPKFALGVAGDMARKFFPASNGEPESFATILERGLGRTICREFYFPYARKLWGLAPPDLAPIQAQRRVSGNSFGKMLRKLANAVPGLKRPGAGRFFYPRHGYGEISERIAGAASTAGAEFIHGAKVVGVECEGGRARAVRFERNGVEQVLAADHVWSTLPVGLLLRSLRPAPPADVLAAAGQISFRGMILIYLVLEQEQFTEYDAHYFPEEEIRISRLSEPKNYSVSAEPRGRTILCAELPADPSSLEWSMTDEELGRALVGWLGQAGLPVTARVARVVTKRLGQAYPVYRTGFQEHLQKLDDYAAHIEGLLLFGRQALFAHDNTHHALFMAYSAADCLSPQGNFDHARWAEFRKIFDTHVVED
jgi:protoporphyrinogen oxidase